MSTQTSALRKALAWAAVILASALVGAFSTKPLLRYLIDRHATHNGPWRTSANTGSVAANPWERAAVAVAGLYALTPQEAVYYTAFTDSSGETLRGECRYRVQGAPPPARWWSLTAYGADHYLVPNAAGVYARHAGNLPPSPDGRFDIALAPQAATELSLPTPAEGPYSVTLRVYNPAPAVLAQLATLPLPTIVRESCP
ncbi:MAG: DUF1214 domain-containing protein [Pseudomonadota bacterium]